MAIERDLNAQAAYIRGLMEGMEYEADSKTAKVVSAMMDLLEEMAAAVTEHDSELSDVYDELETLDEDMADLAADAYGIEDDEDDADEEDDEEALYEVTCPNCGKPTTVDEETLLSQELVCPSCGAAFDIELTTEDEEPKQ